MEQRFWTHVDLSGECWLWTGTRTVQGYGRVVVRRGIGRPYKIAAHRVSYEMAYGLAIDSLPKHLVVCHTCDNPPCVRPDHLFLGTMQDNVNDARSKGRMNYEAWHQRGEENHAAKLNDASVRKIRSAYAAGETQAALAKRYEVSRSTIGDIVRGEIWSHVH